ncbi:MAG: sigma-70 family RNA polymerase sigma factor [bacterium]|nr:sigma-70 family RNA polymerase sigma factor [bacterium]
MAMSERSDEALMAEVSRGDRAAFGMVVERHYPTVVRFAQRFLGSAARQVAEDVAQDVFLKAWRAARNYEPRAKVVTWLLRIATNTCLNHRRRERLRGALSLGGGTVPEPVDMAGGPAAAWESRERAAEVRGAISGLPSRQRAAVVLRHYHELSYVEIAAVLELSVPAVESLLFRARKALRTSLAEMDDGGSPQVSSCWGAEST